MKNPNEQKYPFKTPDGYFDQFTENIMNTVKSEERKKSGLFLSKWFKYSSVAAILLFVLSVVLIKLHEETNLAVNNDTLKTHNQVLVSDSGLKLQSINPEQSISDNEYLSQDLSDQEIIDWSSSMELSDEELVVLISNN